MKLTLISLLICCFASLNGQQYYNKNGYYRQQQLSPRAYYGPFFQPYAQPNSYTVHDQEADPLDQSDFIEFDQDFDGINARGKLQKKFLFGANSLNANLASVLSSLNFPSLTTTVLKTVSSTATIAFFQSCISSVQFIGVGGAATSTLPCSRKRRAINFDTLEALVPSPVEPLEATLLAPDLVSASSSIRDRRSDDESTPEIVSSQEEQIPRNQRNIPIFRTVTATVTSYSFATTTIKKFFTLVGAAALSCLPAGYTVC